MAKNFFSKVALFSIIGVCLLFVSCKKDYEEVEFTGKVVFISFCNTQTMSYVIELTSPENFGSEIELGGVTYENAVVGYESPKNLKQDWQVSGVCYKTSGYGKVACTDLLNITIQEVILLEVNHK